MDYLPSTLCHYTTAEAAFQHIIPSGRLRMSPYAQMRDPLENRDLAFGGAGRAVTRTLRARYLDDIIDRIEVIRGQTRLLSFTIDAITGYT